MADVTINYKGSKIAEMSSSGTKTLKTSGTYCEGDVSVNYVKTPASEIRGDTPFLYLTYTDVTIGANTVARASDAFRYLDNLVGWHLCATVLLTNPTIQNQLIMVPGAMTNPDYTSSVGTGSYVHMRFVYRYRDGKQQHQPSTNDYAVVLPEGSKYRIWISNIDFSDISPY